MRNPGSGCHAQHLRELLLLRSGCCVGKLIEMRVCISRLDATSVSLLSSLSPFVYCSSAARRYHPLWRRSVLLRVPDENTKDPALPPTGSVRKFLSTTSCTVLQTMQTTMESKRQWETFNIWRTTRVISNDNIFQWSDLYIEGIIELDLQQNLLITGNI